MQVPSVASDSGNIPPGLARRAANANTTKEAPEPAPVSAPERARGVIRLLQEGHFKGVADVRLRINFADEIAALQSQANARVAAPGPDAILDEVDAIIDEFVQDADPGPEVLQEIQDARAAFGTNLTQIFTSFSADSGSPGQSLVDAVAAAVNEFIASIESLLPPAATPEAEVVDDSVDPIDPAATEIPAPAADDGVGSGTLALGELLERLREALQSAIEGLQSQFDAAQVLPPLSAPTGNGRAYSKFLEILTGLEGTQSGSVDTAA